MRPTAGRRLWVAALVWLAMLGLDFVLNAAVFVTVYQRPSAFLLPAHDAAARIPLGYLALAIVAVVTVEAVYRLRVADWWSGARLGALLGAVVGAVWALSLYSIATLDVVTALALLVTWVALLTLGMSVAALGLAALRLRGLAVRVLIFDLLCASVVVALQSSGLVPTTRL